MYMLYINWISFLGRALQACSHGCTFWCQVAPSIGTRFSSGPLAQLEPSTNSVLLSLCWSQSTTLPSYNHLCDSEYCCLSGCSALFLQQSVRSQSVSKCCESGCYALFLQWCLECCELGHCAPFLQWCLQCCVSGHCAPFLQQSMRSWSAHFAHYLFQFYYNLFWVYLNFRVKRGYLA